MSKSRQHRLVESSVDRRIVEYLRDHKFSNNERKCIEALCGAGAYALADIIRQWPTPPQSYEEKIRIAVMMLGREHLDQLLDVVEACEPVRLWIRHIVNTSVLHVSELVVNGRDLMGPDVELSRGPMIGECLNELLWRCILDPSQNTRSLLLSHARIWRDDHDEHEDT